MQSSIKFAYTRVMTYIGVLTQNTGINEAIKKKNIFLDS